MPTRRKRGRWRKSSEIRKKKNLDFEQQDLAPPIKLGSGPINLVATLVIGGIIAAFFFIP